MNWILTPHEVTDDDRQRVGGKAISIARLIRKGFALPESVFVPVEVYHRFVDTNGLRERILLELNRKDPEDMRWEEIWDCATRIRHLVLKNPFPEGLRGPLAAELDARFGKRSVAVRSSATDEDAAAHSFAGLHESYINIAGADSILDHVKKVWSSLWSDGALLYRKEIGLDIERSAMAVVIQETVLGDCSGVAFSIDPRNETLALVEAVHGLNQGLVDGAVEPDRWEIDRANPKKRRHLPPSQRRRMSAPGRGGVFLTDLPDDKVRRPPLTPDEVDTVFRQSLELEELYGGPQDVEWTLKDGNLTLLQTRPITTQNKGGTDPRSWYLSLHRSFEDLEQLRANIENRLIPDMIREADSLTEVDTANMGNDELAHEIQRRLDINHRWVNIYWSEFIPYAHGVRLFGRIYNDTVRPDDTYEFV